MKDRVLNVAFEETQVHRLGLSPTSLHLLHTIPVEVGAIAALPYFYYWLEKMYVCAKQNCAQNASNVYIAMHCSK